LKDIKIFSWNSLTYKTIFMNFKYN
jgi:hypothetical protein